MHGVIRDSRGATRRAGIQLCCVLLTLAAAGCSALSPSAVQVLLPEQTATRLAGSTIDNPRGYVPILFINDTRFSSAVLGYLATQGVDVSDPDLRPRVRMRVQTTFITGVNSVVEFIEGSPLFQSSVVVENADGEEVTVPFAPPVDLLQNTLDNSVPVCDVVEVALEFIPTDTQSSIEMFVPPFVKEIRLTDATLPAGGAIVVRELVQTLQPQFRPLLVDTVDDSGTITAFRNFGVREIPGFPRNITCGSVVVFILTGELSLPFVEDERGDLVPGYLDTDVASQVSIPGRFRLAIQVR